MPVPPQSCNISQIDFPIENVLDKFKPSPVHLPRNYQDPPRLQYFIPQHQRSFAWKDRKKHALIDSILIGRPIGIFIFIEQDHPGRYAVEDGQSRLTVMWLFKMDRLRYFPTGDTVGLLFSELPAEARGRFDRYRLYAHVANQTDKSCSVKFASDMFEALNSGTELQDQDRYWNRLEQPVLSAILQMLSSQAPLTGFNGKTLGALYTDAFGVDMMEVPSTSTHKPKNQQQFKNHLGFTLSIFTLCSQHDLDLHEWLRAINRSFDAHRHRLDSEAPPGLATPTTARRVAEVCHVITGAAQACRKLSNSDKKSPNFLLPVMLLDQRERSNSEHATEPHKRTMRTQYSFSEFWAPVVAHFEASPLLLSADGKNGKGVHPIHNMYRSHSDRGKTGGAALEACVPKRLDRVYEAWTPNGICWPPATP